jgi:serine/threonine protein phosphatase PrpC
MCLENEMLAQVVIEEPDVHKAAAIIKHMTMASRSMDNVSVVVVDIEER